MKYADRNYWVKWHEKYNEKSSVLSKRLDIVRNEIEKILPKKNEEIFRVLSICSGDGRDIIGVIKDRKVSNGNIEVFLVDNNKELIDDAENEALECTENFRFILGDGGQANVYKEIERVDLLLFCGVFGHLDNLNVKMAIKSWRKICKRGAVVIWTRGIPYGCKDNREFIREEVIKNGFEEISYMISDDKKWSVGVSGMVDSELTYLSEERYFEFGSISSH